MRRINKQPKSKQMIDIPDNLLEFMNYVHEMIESDDESATIESDDLLQCEYAYGGLIAGSNNLYGFTYFAEKGKQNRWRFEIDSIDIANICEGSKTNLVLWGCQESNCHCMFSDPEDTCFDCDYVDNE